MKYIMVGKIIGTHGIKGEVKVLSDSDFTEERFRVGNTCYLKLEGGMFPIKINSHRKHKGLDLITFNDIDNINDVISYLHAEIFADAELDPGLLAEDEYHYQDLIGLEAISENGESIGTVRDLLEVPQGWILVLKKEDGKEALVPFVSEFVKKIDLEDRKIILTPIEGLL